MPRILFQSLGVIAALVFTISTADAAIDDDVRLRLEAAQSGFTLKAGGETLLAKNALSGFYEQNSFAPIWVNEGGVRSIAKNFIQVIEESGTHGLTPSDYHLDTILRLLGASIDAPHETDLIDLELLLTDAYLLLGSHLSAGKVNPETIDPEWFANRRGVDMGAVLYAADKDRALVKRLVGLAPRHDGYTTLVKRLAVHRLIEQEGGFVRISEGPALKPEMHDARIPTLRQRLRQSGDLHLMAPQEAAHDAAYYDPGLADAVQRFQARHGLSIDGVVGGATLAALNRPVTDRIDQLRVNLERMRWAPEDLGARHVQVNIAGFELLAIDNGKVVQTKRVIVGREYRRTPVFSDQISYLVLNPTWTVTQSIAVTDKLPDLQRDPSKLINAGFDIYQGSGANQRKIDPTGVNWSAVTPQTFSYRLVQRPGPQNALGQVKFMFPNRFNVYLHDTPSRDLFLRDRRTFSSGCVRVEKPMELAAFLLNGQGTWTEQRLADAVATDQTQTIMLDRSVPVHITYLTAWIDASGNLQFRDDIYTRDQRVLMALLQTPSVL